MSESLTLRSLAIFAVLSTLPAAVSASHHRDFFYGDYRQEPLIVVETKDCTGNIGLASFRAEQVFKIQAANCRDPDDSDQPLYQLLLRTPSMAGNYEVVWIDSAGMQAIREQLEENRRAALRAWNRLPDRPVDEGQRED